MAIETRIRRLGESLARAASSLSWYYRTRPDAWRCLALPGLGALLTLFLSVAWGVLGLLLAFVVVGCFAVFAIRLVEELHALEAEARADIVLEAGDVPWLGRLVEAEPSQLLGEAGAGDVQELPSAAGLELSGLARRDSEVELAALEAPAAGYDAAAARSISGRHLYELREVAAGAPVQLQACPSFLEASELAFDLIDQNDPEELEIVRVHGEEQEIVWTYRRSQSAVESGRAFGFDVSSWTGPRD
jgi:hypothetical protein